MSDIKDKVDPEVMIEDAGYKRGYQECQSEMRFKLEEELAKTLMMFCDPKHEHSGIRASDLANKIVKDVFGG